MEPISKYELFAILSAFIGVLFVNDPLRIASKDIKISSDDS